MTQDFKTGQPFSRRSFCALAPAASAASVMLAGCGGGSGSYLGQAQAAALTSGFVLDQSHTSVNQDSRIRSVILHYTALPLEESLRALTAERTQVSAHYLVPEVGNAQGIHTIYQLVPEQRRAWHAGFSYWQGERMINSSSIGIEIVNTGYPTADEKLPADQRHWAPFPSAQVEAVALLIKDIVGRHAIPPHRIVGHGDIAPGRKSDPGPLFPWSRLFAEFSLGAWPEADRVAFHRVQKAFNGDIGALQKKFLAYGYDAPASGILDSQTRNVVTAFQMHFRPARCDGNPDIETVAILDALLEKYFKASSARSLEQLLPGEVWERGEKGLDFWPPAPLPM